MRNVTDTLAKEMADLTEECFKEVLDKFPMMIKNREAVTDWVMRQPWGGTLHRITVADRQVAEFEVGCQSTESPAIYRLYRIGPSFLAEPEEIEKLLLGLQRPW